MASTPGQTMGIGVFTESLCEAVGLGRTNLSQAYLFGTLASAFLLAPAGKLLDKIGSRAMITLCSLGFALSLVIFSQIGSFAPSQYTLYTITATAACFMLIRFFGQGCITMTSRVVIGKWFNHYRGRAVAISGIFTAFGFNSSPRLLNQILINFGLVGSYLVMALFFGLLMAIIGWVFFRDNPEQCGLLMDGGKNKPKGGKYSDGDLLIDFTREEAIRMPAFWLLSLPLAAYSLLSTAAIFHMEAIGAEFSLSRVEAYSVFIPMSLFSIAASFIGSLLSDKIKFKWIVIATALAQTIGLIGLVIFGSAIGKFLMYSGFGITGGLFATITVVGLPKFFGRAHLGAISGFNMALLVFASAVGPYLLSLITELTGSYSSAILLITIMPAVLVVSSFMLKNPQHQKQLSLS